MIWIAGGATNIGAPKQTSNAAQKISSVGRDCEPRGGLSKFFEGGQRLNVMESISAEPDGGVIAAVLALVAHAFRNPPDGRVIEQQSFHQALEKINQVIMPPNVG